MTTTIRLRSISEDAAEAHRTKTTDVLLSIATMEVLDPEPPSKRRIDRLNQLRDTISNGLYFVRSADLADRLLLTLREDSGSRASEDRAGFGLGSTSWDPSRRFRHATFPLSTASDSAEEPKHE